MPSNDLDEHQLAQLGQHAFTTGTLVGRFHGCKADELTEPGRLVIFRISRPDDRRQIIKKRIERPSITREITANKLDGNRAPLPKVASQWKYTVPGRLQCLRRNLGRPHARTAPRYKRNASAKQDHLAHHST